MHGGHSNCKETLFHKGFDISSYRLITLSRPGYGKTPSIKKDTPLKAAKLVIEFLDTIKINKVVVYAISAAGPTAIELAAKYPKRAEKLVLASAVTKKWLDSKDRTYKMAKLVFHPKAERMTWGMIRFFSSLMPNFIAQSFYSQFTLNDSHKLSKTDVNELLTLLKDYSSKKGFLCDIDHNIEKHVLSEVKCPTLIIHSKNDNSVQFEHADYAHKLIKNSRLEKLNNEWGHLFWIGKDSSDSIRRIINFVEK